MLIVKDSMVLIHLSKTNLLEESCNFFGKVFIPKKVFEEVVNVGKEKKYSDAFLVEKLVKRKLIKVKEVKNKTLIKKANDFNIFDGEAESIALYWQKNADFLATDDDNVRKKKEILEINIVGTPSIILQLFTKRAINKDKTIYSINKLRSIGWFNSTVLDSILLEVRK